MNARNPVKTILVLVVVLSVAASIGAVTAVLTAMPRPGTVTSSRAHLATPPRTGVRGSSRPARGPDGGDLDITAYVNLYAIGGVLACFGLIAYWGWWQTHHRCESCGSCPAWCRCREATRPHRR
jgi:hypothetical protein